MLWKEGGTLSVVNHLVVYYKHAWNYRFCISAVTRTDYVCYIRLFVLLWVLQPFPTTPPHSTPTHLIVVWVQLITLLPCMKHPPHFDITPSSSHTPCNLPHAYTSVLYVAWLYQCLFWIMSTALRTPAPANSSQYPDRFTRTDQHGLQFSCLTSLPPSPNPLGHRVNCLFTSSPIPRPVRHPLPNCPRTPRTRALSDTMKHNMNAASTTAVITLWCRVPGIRKSVTSNILTNLGDKYRRRKKKVFMSTNAVLLKMFVSHHSPQHFLMSNIHE